MFGRPQQNQTPARPAAADVARLQGGGLVQVIVTSMNPMRFYLFLNGKQVTQDEVDSFFVAIDGPSPEAPNGVVTATLSHRITTVTGERSLQQTALFPCTVEIVALGRRVLITCQEEGSLEGVWISLGLKADGTSSEVTGAKALQILLNETVLDARLTWNDGQTEVLLPTE